MSFLVAIRTAAERDLGKIEDWYEFQRPGLGDKFRSAVDLAIDHIAERPHAYPMLYRDTRRILIRKFPYKLWFCIQGQTVVVLACIHAMRGPDFLDSRLSEP